MSNLDTPNKEDELDKYCRERARNFVSGWRNRIDVDAIKGIQDMLWAELMMAAQYRENPLKEDLKVVGGEDGALSSMLAEYREDYARASRLLEMGNVSVGGAEKLEKVADGRVANLIKSRDQRIALAYGGCTNCYGKGYATYSGEYSARGMKWPDEPIKYCACERGKQLEKVNERIALEAQQRTDELLDALSSMYEQYCGDKHGHLFMSAGEGASELLERYGRYKFDGAGCIIATLKQSQKEE